MLSTTINKERVSIIGSGNWQVLSHLSFSFSFLFIDINHAYRGSAVGKIIGQNVLKHKDIFETEVRQWVFEETFKGEKLTTLINRDHENPK